MISCAEAIANRRSIRKFEGRPVPDDYLDKIVEAARLAPSGTNRQPWRFVVLKSEEEIAGIAGAVPQPFVTTAAVIFVCCLDRRACLRGHVEERMTELVEAGVIKKEEAAYIYGRKLPEQVSEVVIPPSMFLDLGIAVQNMVLMATALGLGSCWVRLFDPRLIHEILGLPAEVEPVVLLPIGFPAQSPKPRPRLSREEIIIEPVL